MRLLWTPYLIQKHQKTAKYLLIRQRMSSSNGLYIYTFCSVKYLCLRDCVLVVDGKVVHGAQQLPLPQTVGKVNETWIQVSVDEKVGVFGMLSAKSGGLYAVFLK